MRGPLGGRSSASRPAAAALAAVLSCSLCAATSARAESPAPHAIRSAALDPAPARSAAPTPATASDDPNALPSVGEEGAPSDFREAPEDDQPAAAAPVDPALPKDPLGEALLARLNETKPLLARLPASDRQAMLTYYTIVDFKPVWIAEGAFTPVAKSVIARLRAAGEDGLEPDAYPVPFLGAPGRPMTEAEIAEAELKLSAAVVLYARDARGGRVNLASISKLITPKLDLPTADLVLGMLAVSGDLAGERLQAYNPHQPGYLALKSRLAAERGPTVMASHDTKTVRIPVGPVLKVGMSDPRVPQLRAFFDLPERSAGTLDAAPGEPDAYDKDVADAVAKFQRGRGLPDNGNLTRSTIVALALPESSPVVRSGRRGVEAELISNMERWRWLPGDLGSDYVLVNVPEYRLRVYRGGVIRDETRVIVGKPETPTPLFSGSMEYAVVNPYWYVPPSILKTMRGTGGFEVVGRGKTYGLRQPPGPRNALGYIKFLFPNQHSVYLHDTPNRSLFSSAKRAFSHGCVRVDDPFRFADAVLPDTWTAEGLKKLIGKGERTIRLTNHLPVHIGYFTAYVDDAGTYRTIPDLYGYDARIKQALGLSTEGGAMASLPTEPKRVAGTIEPPPTAKPQARSGRPAPAVNSASGMRAAAYRPAAEAPTPVRRTAQRTRRYAPDYGYGEPGLWTPAPAPSQPRGWW